MEMKGKPSSQDSGSLPRPGDHHPDGPGCQENLDALNFAQMPPAATLAAVSLHDVCTLGARLVCPCAHANNLVSLLQRNARRRVANQPQKVATPLAGALAPAARPP